MTLTSNVELSHNSLFKLLIKCPSDRFQKLFHHLVDLFCGQENSQYSNFSDVYSLFEWWDLIDQSKIFLKEFFIQDNTVSVNLELLPCEYREVIKDVLDVRASDLKNELIEKSHAVSSSYLKSFDWKLKLTVASDKMSQINEPRLLLDLDISGNKDKSMQLDLTKDELKMLIDAMEKAKGAVVDLIAD